MQYIDINSDKIKHAKKEHVEKLVEIVLSNIDKLKKKSEQSILSFFTKEIIEEILAAPPHILLEYHFQFFEFAIPNFDLNKWKNFIAITKTKGFTKDEEALRSIFKPIYDLVGDILDYDKFIDKKKTIYDAYDLAENLDIPTCTYCNRMYTKTVIVNKEKLTRPQFDHWFPKSKYPLLQLSFYNLIPSCSICNSGLKGATELNLQDHFHPYVKPADDFKYAYSYDYKKDLNHFEFKIKTENDKARNTTNAFQLKDIYDTHVDELQDLLKIKEAYSESYIHMLGTMTSLNLDKEEIYRLAFGVHYEDALHDRRPLSKMKKDILIELGIMQGDKQKKQENKTTNSPPTSDNKDEGNLGNSNQSPNPDDKPKGEEEN